MKLSEDNFLQIGPNVIIIDLIDREVSDQPRKGLKFSSKLTFDLPDQILWCIESQLNPQSNNEIKLLMFYLEKQLSRNLMLWHHEVLIFSFQRLHDVQENVIIDWLKSGNLQVGDQIRIVAQDLNRRIDRR